MAESHQFHPVFQQRLNAILGELRSLGWRPIVDRDAVRTLEEEQQKVNEGKSKTLKSWHVRSTVGHFRENGMLYTVRGNAADIVDERWLWGGPAANPKFKFWTDLGRVAKKHGCRWGGDWRHFRDVAHIEFLFIEEPPSPQPRSAFA